ncbi:MAG TPA: di-heme oxidoredictase family protein, partial [Gemmataceae bacterium]|nr:di-heme oxidoredictase family protein [Gemmataceae bacterium]
LILPTHPNGTPRSGVIHACATDEKHRETLTLVHPTLPPISQPTLAQLGIGPGVGVGRDGEIHQEPPRDRLPIPANVQVSQRNTPALFGARLIDAIPDRVIIAQERAQRVQYGMAPSDGELNPVGRAHRLPDGKIGRFGWKAQTAHLAEFVQAACANELGLGNPREKQPKSLAHTAYEAPGLDLTQQQCDELTAFVAALPRPTERLPADAGLRARAHAGKALFSKVGCADCHTSNLGSVEGIYSDLLLHRMGSTLEGGGSSYGSAPIPVTVVSNSSEPLPDEWRTPPLWGVADSGPYLHDGRARTLQEAILMHGGQGRRAAQSFAALGESQQGDLIEFLRTLRAP